jgi:hypothetical protein
MYQEQEPAADKSSIGRKKKNSNLECGHEEGTHEQK